MKQNDKIEDLFQSTFDDFSVDPPQNVKSSIDATLFNSGGKKKWGTFILSSLLMIVAISGYFIYSNSTSSKNSQHTNKSVYGNKLKTEIKDNSISSKNNVNEKKDEKNEPLDTEAKPIIETSNSTLVSSIKENAISQKVELNQLKTYSKMENNEGKEIKRNAIKNSSEKIIQKENKSGSTKNDSKSVSAFYSTEKGIVNTSVLNVTNESEKGKDLKFVAKETSVTSETNEIDSEKSTTNSIDQNTTKTILSNENSNTPLLTGDKKLDSSTIVSSNLSKNDSVSASISVNDSLNTSLGNVVNSSSTPVWMLSLRTGSTISSNKIEQEIVQVLDKNGVFVNFEASYIAKNKLSISSGLQYNKMSTDFKYTSSFSDNVLTGYDTVLTYSDTANPNMADTSFVAKYSFIESSYKGVQVYSQTGFSIPFYIGYTQQIRSKFYLDATAGFLFSYQQAKLVTTDLYPITQTVHNLGFKLCIRPQIRYQFGKFGVSVGSNLGYDLAPALNWDGVKRKRLFSEIGVGIHYQF